MGYSQDHSITPALHHSAAAPAPMLRHWTTGTKRCPASVRSPGNYSKQWVDVSAGKTEAARSLFRGFRCWIISKRYLRRRNAGISRSLSLSVLTA